MLILMNYKNDGKNIPWKIIAEFKGNEIEGCEYEQLLPFEANSQKLLRNNSWCKTIQGIGW